MTYTPQCLTCRRYRPHSPAPAATCDAYPDGIPDAILTNTLDHRQPQEGDHGLTYTPNPDAPFDFWQDLMGEGD